MTERDELVRVIAEALRPALYTPTVSVFDVSICHGQTFDEALAGARAHVERQAAAVVDALGEHLARASSYEVREHADAPDFPLDEVVATNPRSVHLERMSRTGWWLGIDMPDGTLVHVNLGATNVRAKGYAHVDIDPPTTESEDS